MERRPRPRLSWPADIVKDVDEEIASHLESRREEYAARGVPFDEAAAAALRRFGNRARVADECRRIDRAVHVQERRSHMLSDLRQDVGYAVRSFRRSPGFATIAVLTLAIGTGATTTIFMLANWALLRPVPGVTDPERVSVFWVGSRSSDHFSPARLSYPNLADSVARLETVSLGAYQAGGSVPVAGGGQSARAVSAQYVTAGYFDVLGVRMQIGRPFTAAEDTPPSPLLGAVISDRLWQSMFHRDPDVLRQTLQIAGVTFVVLGVAPPAFHGTERLSATDLWLPGAATPIVRHMKVQYDARTSGGYYELVARPKPGATVPRAQAELESLRAWLRDEYPVDNKKFATVAFHLMGPIGPPPYGRGILTKVIGFAAGSASLLVLLIACANVAGLQVVRGVARRGEIGIRKALGAGRARLVRQQIVESLLLWTLGSAAALVIVLALNRSINLGSLVGAGPLELTPSIDWRVLIFSAGLCLIVGLASSIEPALRVTRAEAVDALRASSPSATRRTLAGTMLAVFQLAASLTLLVGAYLLTATIAHLSRVPLGFDPNGVYVFDVRPGSAGYANTAALAYLDEFQQRLRGIPGVTNVASANGAPFFGGAAMTWKVRSADAADAPAIEVRSDSLFSPAYFETLGIPLLRGRLLTDADLAAGLRGESRDVVISDNLARRLFGAADPIGRGLAFPGQRQDRYDIVGVVGTARYRDLVTPPDEMFYEASGPRTTGIGMGATMVVRTDGSVALAERASAIATALNPSLPLSNVIALPDAVGRSRSEWNSLAIIIGILAALATVLGCIGLYGVVAHGVAQRRREMGIRLALGATNAQLWALILRQTALITGAGIAGGLAGGYGFARVLTARLVGVNPYDPVLWGLATLSLIVVAALASIVPTRAATRVDVTETLRAL